MSSDAINTIPISTPPSIPLPTSRLELVSSQELHDPPVQFVLSKYDSLPYQEAYRPIEKVNRLLFIPCPMPHYTHCAIPYDSFNPYNIFEHGAYLFEEHKVLSNHPHRAETQNTIANNVQAFLLQERHDRNEFNRLRRKLPEQALFGDEVEEGGQKRLKDLDVADTEHWRQELGWLGSRKPEKQVLMRVQSRSYYTHLHEPERILDWSHEKGEWIKREPGHERSHDLVIEQLSSIEGPRPRIYMWAAKDQPQLEFDPGPALDFAY